MTTTPDARPVSEARLTELIRDCEEASRQAALFFPEPGRVHEHSAALLAALRELQSLRAKVERLEARVYDQSTPEAVIRCRNAELLDERQRHLDTIASLEKEAGRLRAKVVLQRRELRRLNKTLGPYWSGFRRGLDMAAEVRLRGIMNKAFGHKAVHAAEAAAIDAAMKEGG